MNLKLIKLQAVLCAIFTFMLIAEWGYGDYSNKQLQESMKFSLNDGDQGDELPKLAVHKSNGSEFTELLERPLFLEGRKPLAEVVADAAPAADVGQIDDWLLMGIFNKDKRPIALFAKRNEAKKYHKYTTEQQISGWVLKDIQADRVILQQGPQQKTVLLRKPRADVKPTPGAPNPSPLGKPGTPPPPRLPKAAPPVPVQQPNNPPPTPENENNDT
jgi:hypothetical protein